MKWETCDDVLGSLREFYNFFLYRPSYPEVVSHFKISNWRLTKTRKATIEEEANQR